MASAVPTYLHEQTRFEVSTREAVASIYQTYGQHGIAVTLKMTRLFASLDQKITLEFDEDSRKFVLVNDHSLTFEKLQQLLAETAGDVWKPKVATIDGRHIISLHGVKA